MRPGRAPRRGRRRNVAVAALAVLALAVAGSLTPAAAAGSARGRAQPLDAKSVSITIADVSPSTPPATTGKSVLTVTLVLRNNTDQSLPTVTVVGQRGDPISTRQALDSAISHPQPPTPELVAPFTSQKPVTLSLGPRAAVPVTYSAVTSTDNSTAPGLCLCQDRIYPLYFAAHSTDLTGADIVVGTAETFVPSFGDTPHPAPVRVAWVWPLLERPHRLIGDQEFLDDDLAYLVSGGRLDRALQVVEAVADHGVAMTVLIDPELVDELAVMATGKYTVLSRPKAVAGTGSAAARSWLDRLRAVLTADPKLQLDFTAPDDPDVESLTRNELSWSDVLSPEQRSRIVTAVGGRPMSSTVAWPVDGVVSSDTLATLARTGATSVIVSDRTLPVAPGTAGPGSRLATVQTAAGEISADVTASDMQQFVSPSISGVGNGTSSTLPQLVSEVAVDAVATPDTSGFVVLAPPRAVNPIDPAAAARAVLDTAATAWSTSITLDAAAHSVATGSFGQLVPPPATSAGLPPASIDAAREVSAGLPQLATMMSTADASTVFGPLPAAVQRVESAAWRQYPAAGADVAGKLTARLDAIRSGVRIIRPVNGTYTLASSNSPLPVTVENSLSVPVTVTVQVTAVNSLPGFRASPVQRQTIAPNSKVILHVPTRVERTGKFEVEAVLLTPSAAQIGNPVFVSVHSTALGTIGVIITIVAAVVLVLALLIRLIRRMRRPRPPAVTVERESVLT